MSEEQDLTFDAGNVNRHGERSKTAISKSLKQFGAGRSILADKDGVIRAGNGTAEQWLAQGGRIKVIETDGTELIAVKRTDMSGSEAIAYAIADNQTAKLSDFDDTLIEQLDALQADGFAMDDMGFDDIAMEDLARSFDINGLMAQGDPEEPADDPAPVPPVDAPEEPPEESPKDENIVEVKHVCPSCAHQWTGRPDEGK